MDTYAKAVSQLKAAVEAAMKKAVAAGTLPEAELPEFIVEGLASESDAEVAYRKAEELIEELELRNMLSGEEDKMGAIVDINAGAGGTEALDWASMLLRMYTRWAERRNFSVTTMDMLPGDDAGVKSVTILISGLNAYGYLKAEKGVHRLVRISPFDSSTMLIQV